MANEYLQRTPTSTGNRRVFTWSGWIKINSISSTIRLFNSSPTKDNLTDLRINTAGSIDFFDRQGSDASTEQVRWIPLLRDFGSWYHILINADTTQIDAANRVRCFVNGVELSRDAAATLLNNSVSVDTPPRNQEFHRLNGSGNIHYIGANLDNSLEALNKNEFTDVFFIDGQALTPDVFGFYKQGKGYISAGSTQATDFRPGQWVPKTPRVIKTEINRRGGFGVNGFYLPMNDSRNFGADFHGEPNSIITLNEQLPQPRVGVATTASVGLGYTDVLRADPYAANLVLAIPGVSTTSNPNLISNGNFSTGDFTSWSINGTTTPTISSGGALLTTGVLDGAIWQSVSSANTKWIIRWTITTNSGGFFGLLLNNNGPNGSGGSLVLDNITTSGSYYYNGTITAVEFRHRGSSSGIIDNIELVAMQTSIKDYSADIKGSGTNKTLTSNATAGIDDRIPSYYGSSLSFDGNGDYLRTSSNISDFQFGTGDFTIETWLWKSANGTNNYDGVATLGANGSANDGWFLEVSSTRGYLFCSAGGILLQYNVTPNTSQWNHLAVCRKSGTTTMYLNGVAVAVTTSTYTVPATATTLDIGGYAVGTGNYWFNGYIQDLRVYKGVAKYTGGFDVPRPYTPVGIATWRAVADTTANNFATLNPLDKRSTGLSLSTGNLYLSGGVSNEWSTIKGNVGVSTGKWYWEISNIYRTGSGSNSFGAVEQSHRVEGDIYIGKPGFGSGYSYGDGVVLTTSDVIGIALDMNNGVLTWYKNGTQVQTQSGITSSWMPAISQAQTNPYCTINFGQNPTFSGNTTTGTFTDSNGKGLFKYQPPSGFLALCEDNLPTPAISDPGKYFKTVLYTGDGNNARSIVGIGFTPDLVWIKDRSVAYNHILIDSVRGATYNLHSNNTNTEATATSDGVTYGTVTSFGDNSISLSKGSTGAWTNNNGENYVAWCWRAGAGTTSTNTNGSITSVVSVNQDAGFSIVSGLSGGSGASSYDSYGHGLGKTPSFIIVKNRDLVDYMYVYHKSISAGAYLILGTTNAAASAGSSIWGTSFGPNSTTLTVRQASFSSAANQKLIFYCWAEIEGFSKFGSYVGNGSADGPFVYCGFKPAWVMIKRTDGGSENWIMFDNSRKSVNDGDQRALFANITDIEGTGWPIDFLSNGFKNRYTGSTNQSGATYIFAAWAESPFSYSNSK